MPIYSIVTVLEHEETETMIGHAVIFAPSEEQAIAEVHQDFEPQFNEGWSIVSQFPPVVVNDQQIMIAAQEVYERISHHQ